MLNIGKRIKELRIKHGLSAEDLAPLVGLSPATIYRYENGDIKQVNTTKLQSFAKVLNTTEAYLMGWMEDDASTTSNAGHENTDILYISKPSGDMKADEVRRFLHETIDSLSDEDLMFMKDFSMRLVRKDG